MQLYNTVILSKRAGGRHEVVVVAAGRAHPPSRLLPATAVQQAKHATPVRRLLLLPLTPSRPSPCPLNACTHPHPLAPDSAVLRTYESYTVTLKGPAGTHSAGSPQSIQAVASTVGYSKVTSLPVSFLYTPAKVSTLYSVVLRSLGSRYTWGARGEGVCVCV